MRVRKWNQRFTISGKSNGLNKSLPELIKLKLSPVSYSSGVNNVVINPATRDWKRSCITYISSNELYFCATICMPEDVNLQQLSVCLNLTLSCKHYLKKLETNLGEVDQGHGKACVLNVADLQCLVVRVVIKC